MTSLRTIQSNDCPFWYSAYGMAIASEFAIDGLDLLDEKEIEPDVIIQFAEIDCEGYPIRKGFLVREIIPEGFLYSIKNVGNYLVQEGSRIYVQPTTEEASMWQMYLQGSVFGALLQQRGFLTLHGSAVLVGGAAQLILGDSGMGKSSIAMHLSRSGYPLLTDDICAIKIDNEGEARLYPGSRYVKLWEDALDVLGIDQSGMPKVRDDLQKFRMVVPTENEQTSYPIGKVLNLHIGATNAFEMQRLDLMKSLHQLNLNVYRKNFLKDMKLEKRAFEMLSIIAQKTTCFLFSRSHAQMDVKQVSKQVESAFKA